MLEGISLKNSIQGTTRGFSFAKQTPLSPMFLMTESTSQNITEQNCTDTVITDACCKLLLSSCTENEDYWRSYELCSWIIHAIFSRMYRSMFYVPFS